MQLTLTKTMWSHVHRYLLSEHKPNTWTAIENDDGKIQLETQFEFDLTNAKKKGKPLYQKQKRKQERKQKKRKGFKFQNVMCSTTQEDQNGLTFVLFAMQSGWLTETEFEFSNGNTLLLNAENSDSFAQKWTGFRQRLMSVE